jgi:hypothetical protein
MPDRCLSHDCRVHAAARHPPPMLASYLKPSSNSGIARLVVSVGARKPDALRTRAISNANVTTVRTENLYLACAAVPFQRAPWA